MDTNEEVRRKRLAKLCLEKGGVKAVAEKAEMNWQSLDQVIKGVLLPAKANGERKPRSLGDDAARKLENVFKLGRGWFDWPFEGVDFAKWQGLDEFQRAFVQGRLEALLDEASQKAVPTGVKKEPVSDRKVEKHYKTPKKAEHNH